MTRSFARLSVSGIALSLALWSNAAQCETINDALQSAYNHDPSLLAQRAALRAVDESYVRARAQYGPQITASAEAGYDLSSIDQQDIFGDRVSEVSSAVTGSGSLVLNQQLYSGGHTAHQIDAALAQVLAAREALRGAEIQSLHSVVQAYVDVQTNIAMVKLEQEDIDRISRLADETQTRFDRRSATKTDVSQSNSRLQGARIQLIVAQGRLEASRARFIAATGVNPSQLASVDGLPNVPQNADQAFDIAEKFNPQLLQAAFTERASATQIDEARTATAASLSLQVGVSGGPVTPYDAHYYGRSIQALVVFNKPIFTAGLAASNVRASVALNGRDKLNIESVRRNLISTVSQAWTALETAERLEEAQRTELKTQEDVNVGIDKERSIGLRTLTDALNSAEELQRAKIAEAKSHGEVLVAQSDLLAAIGVLDIRHLSPSTTIYDPAKSFRTVSARAGGPMAGVLEHVDRIASKPATFDAPALRPRLEDEPQ